ncbi:uncharacterized protein F4822DRAFT_301923 [Hypoxylon trugodes]|uniref:uncharacterized protein n=1 Tax=Hypoxylon trugodes TaxID=326681 RepID=UPI00219A313E|nr:uncharacterized protein F4822DRAFT_301923 [Hypoxylon trugodes]KAI1388090.1 hypothetical protein F4822DRAFT_301923 [Hypoxylon trugodes]
MAAILIPSEPPNTSTINSIPYTRLHITPLDESLLGVVVPSSVLPRARNISYHTIETFPEKRYGFVELPTADADKLKTKLNGAVLRGAKMRIEKARPESIPEPRGDADATETRKEKKKSKKRKREIDVTPGVELEGRKVKRGWTTSEREMIDEKRKKSKKDKKSKDKDAKKKKKEKKREVKSKYTDGPECLFKTKLPDVGSSSKDNEEATEHKKKKRKSDREVVVHEFEKTTKHPSFLKANVEKVNSGATTYEDGVGWVDENGTIVEPIVSKRPRNVTSKLTKTTKTKSKVAEPAPPAEEDDDTSSSGSSSEDSEDDSVSDGNADSSDEEETKMKPPPKELKLETQVLTSPVSIMKPDSARPKSSSSITSLTIKIPPVTPSATKVHPLEALYKKPKGDTSTPGGTTKEAEPFSFFDEEDDDIEEDDNTTMGPPSQPPMTPFTKQDFEFRNLRSAAPTPDTAHPGRTFNLWPRHGSADDRTDGEDDDDEEENGNDGDTTMTGTNNEVVTDGDKQTPISDFQKQFWESRGDLNRSWRKRRKAASKEKRYRENRSRAERAI